jgi:catechol 2,3-dioxygenase-like lactoylglutathione lyase family enzyme
VARTGVRPTVAARTDRLRSGRSDRKCFLGRACLIEGSPNGTDVGAALRLARRSWLPGRMHLEQFALIVHDYDDAIRFFVGVLEFKLVEDSPSLTTDGRPKRWVVVRPPGAATALLLAQADGEHQMAAVGNQFAGRVGLFLRVNDFGSASERLRMGGVEFVTEPRDESYGRVVVFLDVSGNRWDLLGPRPSH